MPEKQGKYYKIPINKDTTITDLIENKLSPFYEYKGKVFDLLLLSDGNENNLDRIYRAYSDEDQKNYETDYESNYLENISSGTVLLLEESKLNPDLVSVEGDNLFVKGQTDFLGFWAESMLQIQNDDGNVRILQEGDESKIPIAQLKNYNASVWIYSKALDTILDVSPFIYSLNIQNSMEGGGSFNISLDAFDDISQISSISTNEYISMYQMENRDTGKTPLSYFSKYFGHKDVVWIRFDKLKLEKKRSDSIHKDLIVNKSNIPGNIYDMIGLIDVVQESMSVATSDKMVNISGQDLTKLLSDDGAYFYPVMFADGAETLMFNIQETDKVFKRFAIDGKYESFFTYSERSIRDSMGFVINQLSNLGVVDNNLFSSYVTNNKETGELEDRRTKVFRIINDEDYVDWAEANGIWQIVDLLTDNNISDRRQVDSLLVKSEGNLLDFMNSICQKPFVEFFADTYGDKFAMMARQPPYGQKAVLNWLKNNIIEIDAKDVYSSNLSWETEFYTWYQIEPNNSFLGYDKYTSLSYVTIINFPTIADVFGNHRYMIADSYIDKRALNGSQEDLRIDPFRSAVIEDLAWIIESTQYLPFTRKGSITINRDRRIKKGTWIYYKPTNEICYVKSVSHSMTCSRNSIDGTTVIQVERCMILDYIYGRTVETENGLVEASYFNIIDVSTIKKQLNNIFTSNSNNSDEQVKTTNSNIVTQKQFDVNKEVFNFFVKRRQFDKFI